MQVNELIVDAFDCQCDLNNPVELQRSMERAVERVGGHIVRSTVHAFQPSGVTLCFILQGAHCLLNTRPDDRFAVFSIFLSDTTKDPRLAWDQLSKELRPSRTATHEITHHMPKKSAVVA